MSNTYIASHVALDQKETKLRRIENGAGRSYESHQLQGGELQSSPSAFHFSKGGKGDKGRGAEGTSWLLRSSVFHFNRCSERVVTLTR